MNGLQFDPKVAIWLNVIYAVLTGLTTAGLQAAGIADAAQVVAIAGLIAMPLNIALHTYSSSQPGPLAPPDPPGVVKATLAAAARTVGALLVGLLVIGALALGSPSAARAAGTGAPVKPSPFDVVTPAGGSPTPAAGTTETEGPLSELADLFASDFASAATLATATSIKDGNGQACWTAFGPFGELVKAHPNVFSGKLATDLEAQRLLVMNARKLCDNVACQTVFTEASAAVSKVTSALPVSINVNVTPVNLFAKACADVPNIAVVTPTVLPTPAATPTATPTGG